jgi:hypothetical protein
MRLVRYTYPSFRTLAPSFGSYPAFAVDRP